MKLDDFVSATNLARYRRMLDESKDDTERETLRKLLAEENAKVTSQDAVGEKKVDLASEPEA